MPNFNPNVASQSLDVAGSLNLDSNKTLSDEALGLGQAVVSGTGASLISISSGQITISGLFSIDSTALGNFITITGAINGANNGTFSITEVISATSIKFNNSLGVIPDAGSISWIWRRSYSLEDDLNFERTDRAAIKGTSFDGAIPTYVRPDATSTNVPANLTNIAGKTTDARGFIFNKDIYNVGIDFGDSSITLSSPGSYKHSTSINKTGVPCFDLPPYNGNFEACYVEIKDGYNDGEVTVSSGIHQDEKIFGVTQANLTISPNEVDVVFYSCPRGQDIKTSSSLYTWDKTSSIYSLVYGYFDRLDLIPDELLRKSTIRNVGLTQGGSSNNDDKYKRIFLLMGA